MISAIIRVVTLQDLYKDDALLFIGGGDHDIDNYWEDDFLGSGSIDMELKDLIDVGPYEEFRTHTDKYLRCSAYALYHIFAFIGNTLRCAGYLLLFPLGLPIGAISKSKDKKRDYLMVFRRSLSNLKFMGHNVAMFSKYTLAMIPRLNRKALPICQYCS